LGASGGIEAVILSKAIVDSKIPPTINLDNPDPACDLDYIPNQAVDLEVEYAMSNSFGFGGHNACIVFARYSG
jgi:3-oxoacyl-[acyl-carrier-protein] synthase II